MWFSMMNQLIIVQRWNGSVKLIWYTHFWILFNQYFGFDNNTLTVNIVIRIPLSIKDSSNPLNLFTTLTRHLSQSMWIDVSMLKYFSSLIAYHWGGQTSHTNLWETLKKTLKQNDNPFEPKTQIILTESFLKWGNNLMKITD